MSSVDDGKLDTSALRHRKANFGFGFESFVFGPTINFKG